MGAALQELFALSVVALAGAWLVWRFVRPLPSGPACTSCPSQAHANQAGTTPLPARAIRPPALRVLRDDR